MYDCFAGDVAAPTKNTSTEPSDDVNRSVDRRVRQLTDRRGANYECKPRHSRGGQFAGEGRFGYGPPLVHRRVASCPGAGRSGRPIREEAAAIGATGGKESWTVSRDDTPLKKRRNAMIEFFATPLT